MASHPPSAPDSEETEPPPLSSLLPPHSLIYTTPSPSNPNPIMADAVISLAVSGIRRPSLRRWRFAFTVISSCRAFCSLVKSAASAVLHNPTSYVSINIHPVEDEDTAPLLALVDKQALSSAVKDKRLDSLARLGGPAGLTAALASHSDTGIASTDVNLRRDTFGSNTYPKPPPKGFFHFVIEPFCDLFLLVLIGCAVLSLAFGIKEKGLKEGWYDGASIFVAVFLVAGVSAVSNFRQARRFDRLSAECNDIRVAVIRDARQQDVSIYDIVVGDVVCLNIGDQIPADGLFITGHSLKVDESSMTGESCQVDINDVNPFLTSGVKVVDGYGRMLVTAVGMNTTWGQMMSSITRDTGEETPLQQRLTKLSSSIGYVGMFVAGVVLAVLCIRYFTGSTRDDSGNKKFTPASANVDSVMNALVEIVSAAVTIIVVAVPEGLPLAVTLTLAYSMKKMMKDHAMVRKLSACETMGSATIICTDKTGTLTLNQMKVTSFLVGGEEVGTGSIATVERTVLELLHQGVALNSTGNVFTPDNPALEPEISGSPTEKALLSWAVEELGMQFNELKKSSTVIHVEAFNSEKKRSGVLMKKDNVTVAHWKGAAEMILGRCSNYFAIDGGRHLMDAGQKKRLEQTIKDMAAESLRCIAFGYKEMEDEEVEVDEDGKVSRFGDEQLTLLGFVGIKDPCRPGVRLAVETCRSAGVGIKMITGDNVFTARAIAIECGILRANGDDLDGLVVEGHEFRNYSAEERMELVDRIRVMARSSPFDKLLMVQCLKQKGHVVAVTGDGTNDAPALKEADIGLSMGIQGTEVAKESSDIIIMDDNFDTVVTVMRWGRCVYNNIQKFLQFQLTVNVAALVINFVSSIYSGEVPLTTVQLLWVNLIMDTLGALALATESPTKELMKKPPVGRTAPLISNAMWRNLIAQALYQIVVLLVFQFKGRSIFNVSKKVNNTLIFNTFVLCQVFNEFNSRKIEKKNVFEGIHKSRLFLAIVGITVVLQVIMVELLKNFADTEMLDWAQWGMCVGIAAVSWPIGWLVKCIPVSDAPMSKTICNY